MYKATDEFSLLREKLAKDVIGEIVLSERPENVIKKWRNIFKISQKDLANELEITPSVVSDYESGRRSSPGIKVIRKYVESLLVIDARRGGNIIKSFKKSGGSEVLSEAILDIKEFSEPIKVSDFCSSLNANLVAKGFGFDDNIYGYTVIDSLKAITELSFQDLIKLYGITTQRALIFTKVSTGKTPLVAIKLTNLRPSLVVLHGLDSVDDVAKRIAEVEGIPLAVCRLEKEEKIMERLSNMKRF